MFLKDIVDIPTNNTKIVVKTNKSGTYVNYEYDRVYIPEKKYTNVKRTTIGRVCEDDKSKMHPNENYVKYFGKYEVSEISNERSSCLKIGSFLVLNKFIKDYKLDETFEFLFGKQAGLLLDFVVYSIVTENNVAQYYSDYAYNHVLLTNNMKIYSDSTISDLFKSVPKDKFIQFINTWNHKRDKNEKIYISYDSTSKVCQSGEIDLVEEGYSKNGNTDMVVNYSICYDCKNEEALLYENYPGSVTDVVQLQTMINKVMGLGYKNIGFILDRGYFSKNNIKYMDKNGYNFIIMVKGLKDLVIDKVIQNKGTFESKWNSFSSDYGVYGTTVKTKLYEDDKERYLHIFFNSNLATQEREQVQRKIKMMENHLSNNIGKELENTEIYEKYFKIEIGKDKKLAIYKVREEVVEKELEVCGYFAIVSSEEMKAIEALKLYKGRDASEKLFRADKSFLGDGTYRVASSEAQETKVFIEFIALILRNKLYRSLINLTGNQYTVPAAIRELEKIEIIKMLDGKYVLDSSITKTQKQILDSCGIDTVLFKEYVQKLQNKLVELNGLNYIVGK